MYLEASGDWSRRKTTSENGLEQPITSTVDREGQLQGSWDLVTRVVIKVTILVSTYSPN